MYTVEQRSSKSFLGNETFSEGFEGPEPRNLLKDLWGLNLKVFWRICGALGPDNYKLCITHKKPPIWTHITSINIVWKRVPLQFWDMSWSIFTDEAGFYWTADPQIHREKKCSFAHFDLWNRVQPCSKKIDLWKSFKKFPEMAAQNFWMKPILTSVWYHLESTSQWYNFQFCLVVPQTATFCQCH